MEKSFMSWTKEYEIGVPEIDSQHMKIVDYINELYIAFMNKTHVEKLSQIIEGLKNYSQQHFTYEEMLFQKYSYTQAREHKKEHDLFIEKINEFSESYKRNPNTLTFQVLYFLQKWLIDHIAQSDKKYVIQLFR